MRFSQRSGTSTYLAAFNFSSLTDIVMLLLIFFLLTSSFVTTRGLDVTLPQTDNAAATEEERLYVSINEKQEIAVNDQKTTLEGLPELIRTAVAKDTSQIVVLRADKSLELGDVIGVIDVVKGAGAKRFFIATENEK